MIKIETQIKNIMVSFIKNNGVKDADITINGDRFFLVAPNRFGPGYIRLISQGTIWSADFKKDGISLSTPKSRVAAN